VFRLPNCPASLKSSAARSAASEGGRIFIFWSATILAGGTGISRRESISSSALRVWICSQQHRQIEPRFAPCRVACDWHQITLLSVESSRCPLWHKPGLLLIGDAAHVMSPVGGVGINYAIQDPVASANVLTAGLKSGCVSDGDLAEVQRQREWPIRVIQSTQSFLQRTHHRRGPEYRTGWERALAASPVRKNPD